MPDLFLFQRDLIARVQAAFGEPAVRAVVMQLPCGGGKTACAALGVIAPAVARSRRVVFVADLEELVDDTAERLRALAVPCGVVKAGRAADPTAPVQVCSVQTLARRLADLPPADRVILDECHIAGAPTTGAILQGYPRALLLGLTATPCRADNRPLAEFQRLVCGPSARELVALGRLVPMRVLAPAAPREGAVAMDPVDAYMALARGHRAVIFVPDRATALGAAARLTAAGYPTEAVLGGMAPALRRSVRVRLTSGETRCLVTCRALLKGFDAPVLDAAILATACGSVADYLQALGRAMRAAPGKTEALGIDLRGACLVHGLPEDERTWTLEGASGAVAGRGPGLRRCRDCHAIFPAARRCPRCGSAAVQDPRPLRVQRAEMLEASRVPAPARARAYLARMEEIARVRGVPAGKCAAWAREKAPSWVREALAEQAETVTGSATTTGGDHAAA